MKQSAGVRYVRFGQREFIDVDDALRIYNRANGTSIEWSDFIAANMTYCAIASKSDGDYKRLMDANVIEYPPYMHRSILLVTEKMLAETVAFIKKLGPERMAIIRREMQKDADELQHSERPEDRPNQRTATQPMSNDKPKMGFVYVVGQQGIPGFYKIGKTRNLDKRLSGLQTGSPHKLYVFHSVECTNYSYLEGILHGRYAAKRGSGEWFRLTEDELDELKSLTVQYGRVTIKPQNKRLNP